MLSSVRLRRGLIWLGVLTVLAAIVVVKTRDNGSSSSRSTSGSILSQDQFEREMAQDRPNIDTDRTWEQIPASARVAVRRFIIDGAGERNLARAWKYTHSDLRGGLSHDQWLHGSQLPFAPFTQMNLKLPTGVHARPNGAGTTSSPRSASPRRTRSGADAYTFNVGATKVGTGARARWLVNYWMPLYTPPVRADPTQNFGG